MDGFLKLIGMAIFVVALGAVVVLAASTHGAGATLIVYGLPVMVSGAAIYALGAILNNLIALRDAADRQAASLALIAMDRRKD